LFLKLETDRIVIPSPKSKSTALYVSFMPFGA
jgi:hypothetical protein